MQAFKVSSRLRFTASCLIRSWLLWARGYRYAFTYFILISTSYVFRPSTVTVLCISAAFIARVIAAGLVVIQHLCAKGVFASYLTSEISPSYCIYNGDSWYSLAYLRSK